MLSDQLQVFLKARVRTVHDKVGTQGCNSQIWVRRGEGVKLLIYLNERLIELLNRTTVGRWKSSDDSVFASFNNKLRARHQKHGCGDERERSPVAESIR